MLEYVPAPQAVHTSALVLAKVPASHDEHDDEPTASACLPASQSVHASDRAVE